MRTPKDFDYDLWTTKENLCMVRVKATGEECEVSRETFRLLRAEEEKLKKGRKRGRDCFLKEENSTVLSVDIDPEDDGNAPAWIVDHIDFAGDVITNLTLELFLTTLTERQRDVFRLCILAGMKKFDYAKNQGVSPSSITKTIHQIQTKAKKFFG